MKKSSHICTIDMRSPACRWGKMCDFLAACVKRRFILVSAVWVALMMLASGIMTWGPCDII